MLYNNQDLRKVRRHLRNNATPQEVLLWKYLRSRSLGFKFRRQHSIGPYIVDFCCPKQKLVIEVDGSQHLDQKQYDEEREKYISSLGFTVIRFWNDEINKNINIVLEKIYNQLNTTP
ncbi:MAG: endonuclease domain-containing protein [bacterium]|nr:endonuclease domain-containing protein [bacterium]